MAAQRHSLAKTASVGWAFPTGLVLIIRGENHMPQYKTAAAIAITHPKVTICITQAGRDYIQGKGRFNTEMTMTQGLILGELHITVGGKLRNWNLRRRIDTDYATFNRALATLSDMLLITHHRANSS